MPSIFQTSSILRMLRRRQSALLAITFSCVLLLLVVVAIWFSTEEDVTIKSRLVASFDEKKQQPPLSIKATLELYGRIQEQHRGEFIRRLERLYGRKQVAKDIFFHSQNNSTLSRGRSFITSPFDPSWEIPHGEEEQRGPSDGTTTTAPYNDALVRRIAEKLLLGMIQEQQARLVWASAGMSSAAGHGNMMSEAYSQLLSDNLRPLFAQLNIDFETRNYGMSAMPSVAELSFCQREIYGADVDILTWDFGQTDGARRPWMMGFFFWRAGMHLPRPPVLTALKIGETQHRWNSPGGKRVAVGRTLQNLGLSVLLENERVWNEALEGIPDTVGKTQAEIDSMPILTRYFKCNGRVETGVPCTDHKWNQTMCNKDIWRRSWHPGFRVHALLGLRTLVLLDALEDSLQWIHFRIDREPTLTAPDLVEQLQKENRANLDRFRASEIPESFLEPWKQLLGLSDDIDPSILWNRQAYCHTARAPSQNRELGMFDAPVLTLTQAKETTSSSIKTVLDRFHTVYQHSPEANCTEPVNWDYRDFYYVGHTDGWKELVVPTQPELAYYANRRDHSIDARDWLGIVAVCSPGASDRRHAPYEPGEIFIDEFGINKTVGGGELDLNGKRVTATYDLAGDCSLLKHEDGYRFPIIRNKIRLRAMSNDAERFVRFTSLVVF